VSVISELTYQRILGHLPLVPGGLQLRNYNGSSIPLLGKVLLSVRHGSTSVDAIPFFATSSGTDIMGVDLFDALGFHIVMGVDQSLQYISETPWRQRWSQVFDGVGAVRGYEHEPLVNPAIKPVMQPLRRIPLALRDEVSEELRRLEKEATIERIESSPWIPNLVVVRKRSGAIPLCVN
jgi:hypothetical protein